MNPNLRKPFETSQQLATYTTVVDIFLMCFHYEMLHPPLEIRITYMRNIQRAVITCLHNYKQPARGSPGKHIVSSPIHLHKYPKDL